MRNTSITLMVAGFAALLLGACSAGGSFETNKPPVAEAGAPLTVNVGQLVMLDGRGSSDPNNNISGFQWTQTAGAAVTLSNASTAQPSFTVPQLPFGATLTFRLVVSDVEGLTSAPDTVTITVSNVTTIAVTGTVRFQRVPFILSPQPRLDYANPVLQPARGVVIRVVTPGMATPIATTTTSSTGTYSVTVPTNTTITIQVEARLLSDAALPRWNIRVQNGANPPAPYRVASAAFNSSAGVQNMDILANMNASGVPVPNRSRDSAPFAILDTIYKAVQTVLTAAPTINMPTLYVDWGSDLGAFFTGQFIALRSDYTEDTDEFDESVIAHEFGHYLESSFSRSDSPGGDHGLGDRLEPSMAFSEGIATAFGAIVRDDPIYLDSFVDNGNLVAFGFNVETNPGTLVPVGGDGIGCWCGESTVWSLGWDLYDNTADANDNVNLGFTPFWQAWTSLAHSQTPALTSIFSFIASLKAMQPGNAAVIDALVTAQNINSATINAFATTETNTPFPDLLPVYADITVGGGAVVLHTTDDAGTYNKVGNHRYLRWVAPGVLGDPISASYTVRLTTSNPDVNSDPDFQLIRSGVVTTFGDPPSPNGEVHNIAPVPGATYVIDAYDCANGCDEPQGIPGDYDLTVTIN